MWQGVQDISTYKSVSTLPAAPSVTDIYFLNEFNKEEATKAEVPAPVTVVTIFYQVDKED